MPKIGLSTHTIRVRQRYKRGDSFEFLGSFGERHSLYEVAHELLTLLAAGHTHNEQQQNLLHIPRLESDGESIWGLIEAGEHGFGSRLVNVKTKKDSYKRSPDDAEMVPHYFLLNLPADTNKGLLILQRFGSRGVQVQFSRALQGAVTETAPRYILDINPHVPHEVMKYLLEGRLKGLTFTRYGLPEEIADAVGLGGKVEEQVKVRTIIDAPRNRFLPRQKWIRDLLENKRSFYEVRNELGFEAESISVTVDYSGSRRTVDFTNPERITPHIDVSDRVVTGPNGHPEFDSIHDYSKDLLRNLAKEIGRQR